jgi:hypothetical protein
MLIKVICVQQRLAILAGYMVKQFSKHVEATRILALIPFQIASLRENDELLAKKSLDNGSNNGNHGKTAVNNLGRLAKFLLLRAQLIHQFREVPAKITWFAVTECLIKSGDFNGTHESKDLKVNSPADSGRGSENISVGVCFAGPVNASLLNNNTDNGKHGNSAVLEFTGPSVVEVSLDVRTTTITKRGRLSANLVHSGVDI